jgi:hypothetical protein
VVEYLLRKWSGLKTPAPPNITKKKQKKKRKTKNQPRMSYRARPCPKTKQNKTKPEFKELLKLRITVWDFEFSTDRAMLTVLGSDQTNVTMREAVP